MGRILDRLMDGCGWILKVAVWGCGALLIASAALVGFDVVARKLFGISVGGADELSSYALAITSTWGFAYALLGRAHIRIDALHERLAHPLQAALDVLGLLALGLFAGGLWFYGWTVLETTLRRGSTANTPLQTPLWIPQTLWFAGLTLFLAVNALLLIRAVHALAVADLGTVRRLAGVRTAGEELDEARGLQAQGVRS